MDTKLRVLCVDDDPDTRVMLSHLLTAKAECIVETAGDVNSALDLACQTSFDLYIVDNRLGGGSGLDLCSRLRAGSPATPIIFYSGDASGSDRQQAVDAGATAVAEKPYVHQLVATVKRLLAPKQSDGPLD
jgi:CheY-like chemotaxis protein